PRGSSPSCCCTGMSTPTACRPAATGSAGPLCATSWAGTCWKSSRAPASRIPRTATPMPGETGFPRADVADDFLRARRRQVLAQLAHRLRGEPDDVNLILPFDDVVAALGLRGEHYLGLRNISLDSVVGTMDSRRDFDRHFRPTPSPLPAPWEP